jgi:hypothetical protein
VVDAKAAAHAGSRQPLPDLRPRSLLGLAHVGEDAEPAVLAAPGVDRYHRDAGPDGTLDGTGQAGLGMETTRPSGRLATAASMRLRIRGTL